MSEDRKKPGVGIWMTVVVVVVLTAYAGAYVALVEPCLGAVSLHRSQQFPLHPEYVGNGAFATRDWNAREKFFAPIHQLDRIVRPHVWNRYISLSKPVEPPPSQK